MSVTPIALYVEDEVSTARLMEKILRQNGFEVVVANSAADAQTKLETVFPHALVIDISLSGDVSGLEWLAQVRKSKFSNIPAVITTASVSKELIQQAGQLQIEDYILKRADIHVIGSKFLRLKKKVEETNVYELNWNRLNARELFCLATGQIIDVQTDSLTIESQVQHLSTMEPILYSTTFFREYGVTKPDLELRQSIALSGQHSHFTYRNEFTMNGWTEEQDGVFRRQFWRKRAG